MNPIINKLKEIAQQASYKAYAHVDIARKDFQETFNPQTVLDLLELLELYESQFGVDDSGLVSKEKREKEAALIAKIEDGLK